MRHGLLERQQETFFFAAMDNGKPVKDLNFNTLPTALYVMQGIAEALKGGACVNTNRRFIGIELDKDYFAIAKKRIEENEQAIA